MKLITSIILASLLVSGLAGAATVEETLKDTLREASSQLQPKTVKPAPIKGFYEVMLEGGQLIYMTESADYFFAGPLYQVGPGQLNNLTEERTGEIRLSMLETVSPGETIDFTPKGEVKASIKVFTDISCAYCRKLHLDMPKLNELGIEIRYMAYPRAGINSSVYRDMVSVWCADDPQQAMTDAKSDRPLQKRDCDNPVAKHYQLGRQLNITGTPTLVFSDGSIMPGYVAPEKLARSLGIFQ
jgi:thiol:disulfide interchange protein DsbC